MTRAQAMKWVNALRSREMNHHDLHFVINEFHWEYFTLKLNFDEIADVIQLIYVEGALK